MKPATPAFSYACNEQGCVPGRGQPADPDDLVVSSLRDLARELLEAPEGLSVHADLIGDYMAPAGATLLWHASLLVVRMKHGREKIVAVLGLLRVGEADYDEAQFWAEVLAERLNRPSGRCEVYCGREIALGPSQNADAARSRRMAADARALGWADLAEQWEESAAVLEWALAAYLTHPVCGHASPCGWFRCVSREAHDSQGPHVAVGPYGRSVLWRGSPAQPARAKRGKPARKAPAP